MGLFHDSITEVQASLFFNLVISTPRFAISHVYHPGILQYQVTDLTWLQYHVHLSKFEFAKYLVDVIIPFLVHFDDTSCLFSLNHVAKI